MAIAFLTGFAAGCTKDKGTSMDINGYPPEVNKILRNKCATTGCHNSLSKDAASGLNLMRWEDMFAGGRSGPAVIPYRPDFSTLCFYINTFDDLGPALKPTMPLYRTPLDRPEVETLINWVASGAPDHKGKIAFGELPARQKLYVANRLCDVVTVLDARTGMPVRYIDVGTPEKNEFPVDLHLAQAGNRWLVSFLASDRVQVFNAANDKPEGFIEPGPGQWQSAWLSADGETAFLADHSMKGKIVMTDLKNRNIMKVFSHPMIHYPRSIFVNEKLKQLYAGSEYGNYITMVDYSSEAAVYDQIVLDGQPPHHLQGSHDPWVLTGDTESQRLWVGCVGSGKVTEVDMVTNKVRFSVDIGVSPTAMVYSKTGNLLFVSSMNDSLSFDRHKGSVLVLDLQSRKIAKKIRAGYQSSGLWLSEQGGFLAVVNTNISAEGPAPHHVTGCAGRNGYLSLVEFHSLTTLPQRYELAVFPSAITGSSK